MRWEHLSSSLIHRLVFLQLDRNAENVPLSQLDKQINVNLCICHYRWCFHRRVRY